MFLEMKFLLWSHILYFPSEIGEKKFQAYFKSLKKNVVILFFM